MLRVLHRVFRLEPFLPISRGHPCHRHHLLHHFRSASRLASRQSLLHDRFFRLSLPSSTTRTTRDTARLSFIRAFFSHGYLDSGIRIALVVRQSVRERKKKKKRTHVDLSSIPHARSNFLSIVRALTTSTTNRPQKKKIALSYVTLIDYPDT